jgi:hypothetical protein
VYKKVALLVAVISSTKCSKSKEQYLADSVSEPVDTVQSLSLNDVMVREAGSPPQPLTSYA